MIDFVFPVYVPDEQLAEAQRECFASFLEHTPRPRRVIVVDNGSTHGVADAQQFADVYVRLHGPVGFASAVNLGWRLCEAPYVCVANNDLVFTRDWLPPLVTTLGTADIVAPSDGTPAEFWGACFLMTRLVREHVGLFDAGELAWRFHDQDYWIRAMQLGYRFQRCPASRVVHRESSTWSKLPGRLAIEADERAAMIARWGTDSAEAWRAGRMGGGAQPR